MSLVAWLLALALPVVQVVAGAHGYEHTAAALLGDDDHDAAHCGLDGLAATVLGAGAPSDAREATAPADRATRPSRPLAALRAARHVRPYAIRAPPPSLH